MKILTTISNQWLAAFSLVLLSTINAAAQVSSQVQMVSQTDWIAQSPATSPYLNENISKAEYLTSASGIRLSSDNDVMPEAVRNGDRLLVRFFNGEQAVTASAANVSRVVITKWKHDDGVDVVDVERELPIDPDRKLFHSVLLPGFDVDSAPPQKVSVELQDSQGQLVGKRLWIRTNPMIRVLARLFRFNQKVSRDKASTTETEFRMDVGTYLSDDRNAVRPDVRGDDSFEIRCFRAGQPVTMADCKVDHVAVTAEGKATTRHPVDAAYQRRNYFYFPTDTNEIVESSFATPITFQVFYKDNRAGPVFFSKRRNSIASYGVPLGNKNSSFGLWIPYGIFASNLKSTAEGIEFSALPVGLAIGTKIYGSEEAFGREGYLGVSAAVTYAITNKGDETVAQQEQKPPSKFTLASASAGLLVDVAGYVYVAGVYVFDFKDRDKPGFKDPGLMLGLGVGPKLQQYIGAK